MLWQDSHQLGEEQLKHCAGGNDPPRAATRDFGGIPQLARPESVLKAASEGIYALEGRATFVNLAAARIRRWKYGTLIGQPMQELTDHARADGAPYAKAGCRI